MSLSNQWNKRWSVCKVFCLSWNIQILPINGPPVVVHNLALSFDGSFMKWQRCRFILQAHLWEFLGHFYTSTLSPCRRNWKRISRSFRSSFVNKLVSKAECNARSYWQNANLRKAFIIFYVSELVLKPSKVAIFLCFDFDIVLSFNILFYTLFIGGYTERSNNYFLQ